MDAKFFGTARWVAMMALILGALGAGLTACGQQVEVAGGQKNLAPGSSEDIGIDHFLGVEEVVQKFQLVEGQQPGALTDAEIEMSLRGLPQLDDIVPAGKQRLMAKLSLSSELHLDAADVNREVIDLGHGNSPCSR